MNQDIVLTVLGKDRPGIVDAIAKKISDLGGSWKESRLAHLQDQFAGIIEITLPSGKIVSFEESLRDLEQAWNLHFQYCVVKSLKQPGELVDLECMGQDRPGIVFAISDLLFDLNINVESMDTSLQNAPMSGEMLFCVKFQVQLPEEMDLDLLEDRLSSISEELLLDVNVRD